MHAFVQDGWQDSAEVQWVQDLSSRFFEHLNTPAAREAVTGTSAGTGVPSHYIQSTVADKLLELEFRQEAKGLFQNTEVRQLRPDYYLAKPDTEAGTETGIIFEVEKGKTLINNMDLLDMWKCHLCATAHHLWLMVPQETVNKLGAVRERPYASVLKRVGAFFTPDTYVNVRSATIFGY